MKDEDHVWNLTTKKLANEASEEELRELNTLLQENPALNNTLKLMFDWWNNDEKQKVENNSHSLFKKIQEHIKTAEARGNKSEQQHKGTVKPGKTVIQIEKL